MVSSRLTGHGKHINAVVAGVGPVEVLVDPVVRKSVGRREVMVDQHVHVTRSIRRQTGPETNIFCATF